MVGALPSLCHAADNSGGLMSSDVRALEGVADLYPVDVYSTTPDSSRNRKLGSADGPGPSGPDR